MRRVGGHDAPIGQLSSNEGRSDRAVDARRVSKAQGAQVSVALSMNLGWLGVPPLGGSNGLDRLKPGLQAVRGFMVWNWRPKQAFGLVSQIAFNTCRFDDCRFRLKSDETLLRAADFVRTTPGLPQSFEVSTSERRMSTPDSF